MSRTVQIQSIPVAQDEAISVGTRKFLNALNKPGAPGLETLSPEEAREVLVNLQE